MSAYERSPHVNACADVFRAMGDETRLRILHLLAAAGMELCCCELTDALAVPQYNISRHLDVLERAGLVRARREGRWVYFSLVRGPARAAVRELGRAPDPVLARDMRELKKGLKLRIGGKCLRGIMNPNLRRKPKKKQ